MARLVKTPGAVIAAAVCLFIYGGLMLLCFGCSGLELAMNVGNDPINKKIADQVPGYDIVRVVIALLNLPTGIIMNMTGRGLLKLRRPARQAAYIITSIEILLALLSSSYTAFLIMPAQERVMAEEAPNLPPGVEVFVNAATWGSVAFSLSLVLLFCVPVLFLLSGSGARAAFASEEFDMPDDFHPRPYADDDDEDDRHDGLPPSSSSDTRIQDRS